MTEYPLFDKNRLCPTARFVGGTSRWLCECQEPKKCKGYQKTKKDLSTPYGGR